MVVGNMANQSSKMRYVVVIYGNICFTDQSQLIMMENCLSVRQCYSSIENFTNSRLFFWNIHMHNLPEIHDVVLMMYSSVHVCTVNRV